MSTLETYYESRKIQKDVYFAAGVSSGTPGELWNHPQRMETVAVEGTLTYTIDERAFDPVPSTSATMWEFSLNMNTADDYTRDFLEKTPYNDDPPSDPAVGHFTLMHRPFLFYWMLELDLIAHSTPVVVGTVTKTEYSRASAMDPWTQDASNDHDISLVWDWEVVTRGGDPTSGGRDASHPAEVRANLTFSGTDSSKLPGMSTGLEERDPWSDGWAAIDLSQPLTDAIADGNTDDGGGHSGSSSMEITFTDQT